MRHPARLLPALLLAPLLTGAGPAAAPPGRVPIADAERRATGPGWVFVHHRPHVTAPQLRAIDARFAQDAAASEAAFKAELKALFGPTLAPAPVPADHRAWSRREVTYRVRHNGGLLAVAFDQVQFTAGAPKPVQAVETRTVMGGKLLALADLFRPRAAWLPALSKLYGEALRREARAGTLAIWSHEGYGPQARNFEAFLPTPRGLSVFFQTGQVASEVSNVVEITVGWPQLRGIVEPAIEKAATSP